MSLVCPVGPESNLLDAGENNCARLVVEHPVLTPEELAALQDDRSRDGWSSATVDATFSREGADQPLPSPDQYGQGSDSALERALADLCERAARAVQGSYGRDGAAIIILSDALAGPDRLPIPTLLAVGAVHQHLLKTGQRGKAALFADCGDVKEVHDVRLRRPLSFLRCRRDASPGEKAVCGPFFEFEPFRTASGPSSRRVRERAGSRRRRPAPPVRHRRDLQHKSARERASPTTPQMTPYIRRSPSPWASAPTASAPASPTKPWPSSDMMV